MNPALGSSAVALNPHDSSTAPDAQSVANAACAEQLCWHDCVQLRDYQQEVVRAVLKHWQQGELRQLVALPTGSGKTVVFLALARYLAEQKALGALDLGVPAAATSSMDASGGSSDTEEESEEDSLSSLAPADARLLAPAAVSDSAGDSSASDEDSVMSSNSSTSDQGQKPFRTLILAHRRELVHQAIDRMSGIWPAAGVSMVMEKHKHYHGQVSITTRSTLPARCQAVAVLAMPCMHSRDTIGSMFAALFVQRLAAPAKQVLQIPGPERRMSTYRCTRAFLQVVLAGET